MTEIITLKMSSKNEFGLWFDLSTLTYDVCDNDWWPLFVVPKNASKNPWGPGPDGISAAGAVSYL